VPQCLVLHDLAFLHHPAFISTTHLRYYKKNTGRFLEKAKVIAAVSEYSKKDIVDNYNVDPSKIVVTPNAPNSLFQPLDYQQKEAVKAQYSAGCEYFIYTGSIHPRKNPVNLLKAFSRFKKRQRTNMKLIFAGRLAWKTDEFTRVLSTFKFRNDVILTGYLEKKELAKLVASAYALVYPSFFEGFGVPPLEALQCEVPAIVSNNSAMPEVGADAYLYIDPNNPDDMAEKMMLIYKDETLRTRLIENGKKRLPLFNWDASAKKMWDCIELAASSE
jgi:glycosyltransferase involved in cell wall biosynthesis